MKGCIKYGNLGHIRRTLHGHFNTRQIGRIVQRGKGAQPVNGFNYLVIDQCRFPKFFAAMHHPMADPG